MESAVGYASTAESKAALARGRRKLGAKLLERPVRDLLTFSDLEMAMLRDSIWCPPPPRRVSPDIPQPRSWLPLGSACAHAPSFRAQVGGA